MQALPEYDNPVVNVLIGGALLLAAGLGAGLAATRLGKPISVTLGAISVVLFAALVIVVAFGVYVWTICSTGRGCT